MTMRIGSSRPSQSRLNLAGLVSSIITFLYLALQTASAHEVIPSIADMAEENGRLAFEIRLNLEGMVAGIDLSEVTDTNAASEADTYDALRKLAPGGLEERFRAFWPEMAENITIQTGDERLAPRLISVEVSEIGNVELVRGSRIRLEADLPPDAEIVRVGWSPRYGALVLRQMSVEKPYDGYLENGQLSDPIKLSGGSQKGALSTFARYIAVGFDHILPKGLDHVLFVLGLFFLSARLRPLFWQISAFTIAHTVTLALSALGYISMPASVVEPIIALSIVYVAVENMFSARLTGWRPFVVFGFGLLHGLGFASVLGEFGLPDSSFVAALIGFNVGVELGQLAVVAIAFAAVGYWFSSKNWYRPAISIPASAIIALVGAYWFVERTVL